MLNRQIAPEIQDFNKVKLPKAESIILPNQIPLYFLNLGQQPIIKLELIFEAGFSYDQNLGVSFFANKMLSEGTKRHTAKQIAGQLEQMGAFIEYGHGVDRAGITVHCLNKHLSKIVLLLQSILTESIFPEKEFLIQKNQTLQNLSVNEGKTAYLAGRKFKEQIFGIDNPYGFSFYQEDINNISIDQVKSFYTSTYLQKPFKIFATGQISEQHISVITETLGKISIKPNTQPFTNKLLTARPKTTPTALPHGSLQTSIRIGKSLDINRKSQNYTKLLLTNEILGGYFGSRLMKNIREEKGLTYGISSGIPQFSNGSYFVITSDVKKENAEIVVSEIKNEIHTLQTSLVTDTELDTAKKFMIGQFIGSINTPFEIMERNKLIILENLALNHYDEYPDRILSVHKSDIQEISNQFLSEDGLYSIQM